MSNVTLGYGFLFDRFTNMLHYPDQKLLGLQFYLNDIGPIGVTLQTVLADFKDFATMVVFLVPVWPLPPEDVQYSYYKGNLN